MKQEALNISRMFIWGDKFECKWLFAQCFLLCTDSNFFAPSLILMSSFQFILNLCVDIWFWVDNPEITHWLLHSKCSDRNMYVWRKSNTNRWYNWQMSNLFLPTPFWSLVFWIWLCNPKIIQKSNMSCVALQIQRQEIIAQEYIYSSRVW